MLTFTMKPTGSPTVSMLCYNLGLPHLDCLFRPGIVVATPAAFEAIEIAEETVEQLLE